MTLIKHQKKCPAKIKTSETPGSSTVRSSRALLDATLLFGLFDNVHKPSLGTMKHDVFLIIIWNDPSLMLHDVVQLSKMEPRDTHTLGAYYNCWQNYYISFINSNNQI